MRHSSAGTRADLNVRNTDHLEQQIKPVQKQTRAGQRTRFKAIVVIGDSEGHVGLGIKTSKEVATAIRAAIIIAKLSVLPIRRGYWGTNLGLPHSLPTKESGKCGSVSVRVSLAQVLW
jgi:small subunit ribosomal protein S2e